MWDVGGSRPSEKDVKGLINEVYSHAGRGCLSHRSGAKILIEPVTPAPQVKVAIQGKPSFSIPTKRAGEASSSAPRTPRGRLARAVSSETTSMASPRGVGRRFSPLKSPASNGVASAGRPRRPLSPPIKTRMQVRRKKQCVADASCIISV